MARTEFESPVEVTPPALSPLAADFKIFENGKSQWLIACRKCKARWALPVSDSPKVGNLLALMNHGASHE